MLNLKDIDASIEYYENQPSSLENCRILADLYTCRKYTTIQSYDNENGFRNAFRSYIGKKRNYQLHKESKENLLEAAEILASELSNLISTLYLNTETQNERDILINTLNKTLQSL